MTNSRASEVINPDMLFSILPCTQEKSTSLSGSARVLFVFLEPYVILTGIILFVPRIRTRTSSRITIISIRYNFTIFSAQFLNLSDNRSRLLDTTLA